MAYPKFISFAHISYVFIIFCSSLLCNAAKDERKDYIVYMGAISGDEYKTSSSHFTMLQEILEESSVENALIRSYKRSFNGFAARLTEKERQNLAEMKGVVSVFPSQTYQLHTTRSWNFMGFKENVKHDINTTSDITIGVIDGGIWPESESFNDRDFEPPPKKWKGSCEGGKNFTCNKKIIGARYYTKAPDDTARDTGGHGTHTASTTAGNRVSGASFYGLGRGTARGGVPSARIAAYKVCGNGGCRDEAILAAFDDAIADGVDVITISIGSHEPQPLATDAIAIGAFHAMEKGVLTVQSAGNDGPSRRTTISLAPWILSVAASSSDRLFVDKVVLGNGKTFVGNSVNPFVLNGTQFPLVNGKSASTKCNDESSRNCREGCIDPRLVKGKIVLCDDLNGNREARRAGAVGSIVNNTRFVNVPFVVALPATALNAGDYDLVKKYLNSSRNPVAEILRSEAVKDSTAPVIAQFSSRGPNAFIHDIMKPDITAPGVNILAAFSPVAPPSKAPADRRRVKYSFLSGTSMSCPHVAGVAAYVKSLHPDWSPAAIKSALMTTARRMDESLSPDAEFAYGSGHLNPVKAADPGLVYDLSKPDYLSMLCILGFDESVLQKLSGDMNLSCLKRCQTVPTISNLNYPAMTATVLDANKPFVFTFLRTVTNVGSANSRYKAKIRYSGLKFRSIEVKPKILSFKWTGEKKTFSVRVTGDGVSFGERVSASLVWSDGAHRVRSPVVVHSYI